MKNCLNRLSRFYRFVLPIALLLSTAWTHDARAQLATGKSKFLGNIVASSVPANYATYWNQITPENASKWGSVEGTRNSMNWSQVDAAYNYAKTRGYPFKFHTLVWGAQYPGWLTSLSQADQRAEVEQWMQAAAQRYPNLDFIDVVNEPVKTPCPFKDALGGNGATGWDWVIWSFQKARQYFPNAKLLINEYGTENDPNARNQYLTIINLLKSRGLIDGIGIQAHYFNLDNMNASAMTTCLNAFAATGLSLYISELDIKGGGSEAGQAAKYQDLFPVMWNHASVKGITLWGYVEGATWATGTGLLRSNGTEKPAMTWLKSFIASSQSTNKTIVVRARGVAGSETIQLTVNNTAIANWTLTSTYQNYTATTSASGGINVVFTNDATGRDVQVDYIQVNGTTRQAEVQLTNTGVYQNGACGGSNSEWLHCNGYIGFGNTPARFGGQDELADERFDSASGFSIHPNPATKGWLTLTFGGSAEEVNILDGRGRTVKSIHPQPNQTVLKVQVDVNPGMYIVQVREAKRSYTKKVIIE